MHKKLIVRDISWLSFNARVLQEAADKSVPLKERIRFLGIFSNNLDEFFRVRVATLTRMFELGVKSELKMHLEKNPKRIMEQIHQIVLLQQNEFNRIWNEIIDELKEQNIFIKTEKQLTKIQQQFVKQYFETEVRSNIIPLMVESIPQFPNLRDKSIYLAVLMSSSGNAYNQKYALIEVPEKTLNRFVILPSGNGQTCIILLEDIIRFNLKNIFNHLGFNKFESWIFKLTRDAEIDIDNDVTTNFIQKIEAGLKKRKKGRPVRFVYDKEMDTQLLQYLFMRLGLSNRDSVIPGSRIHNFRQFMDFPNVFKTSTKIRKSIAHKAFANSQRITDVILLKDVLLSFPYHSFDSTIDLLREAAMDANVQSIQITAYRLAPNSKVMNALINAARNGKHVTVMLELRARFDEEANLEWKKRLEEEGIKVLVGIPNFKVHAKVCLIKRKVDNKIIKYGFVSTGNLNEKTARVYSDFCLFTSKAPIMNDVERLFKYLEKQNEAELKAIKTLLPCPIALRNTLSGLIDAEIKNAKEGKPAAMILKMNSLSDEKLIHKLYDAAKAGVRINLIVRGIFCMPIELNKIKYRIKAISIVDEYLEHARVFVFHNNGHEKVFISSADWMIRNLDHRIEITCPVTEPSLKAELVRILDLQLSDNVKARVLDNNLSNSYVNNDGKKSIRSQVEIMKYLSKNSI